MKLQRPSAAALLACCLLAFVAAPALTCRWLQPQEDGGNHSELVREGGSSRAAAGNGDGGGGRRRRLAQTPGSPPPSAPGPPLGIIVGGQAQFHRIPDTNRSAIIAPAGLIPGPVTVAGRANPQPSFDACALSCFNNSKCTGEVFNWCPADRAQPCSMDPAGGEPLPPGSCDLRNQATLSEGNSIILLANGPGVDTIGGIPFTVPVPDVRNYTAFPGQNLVSQNRLHCPGSIMPDRCRLLGSLQNLTAACDANPECEAIEWSPAGRDGVNASLGSLKGVPGVTNRSAALDLRQVAWNPRVVLLLREGVPFTPASAPPDDDAQRAAAAGDSGGSSGGDGSLSGGAIAGIAIGGVAAGLSLAALALLVAVRKRRRRRWQQQQQAGKAGAPALLLTSAAAAALPAASASSGVALASRPVGSGGGSGGSAAYAALVPVAPDHSAPLGYSDLALQGPLDPKAAEAVQKVPGLAPWAAQVLSSSAQGWEEAVVRESDIQFVLGPDGQPICLGQGAFGSVWRVMLGGHTECAAKVVEWGGRSHNQVEFIQEAAMLRRLRHPHIVSFQAICITETRGILLMEYCPKGDLDGLMNARSRLNGTRMFDWHNKGRKVASDIASGLAYLHHCRVLHLDLKPHNVLLSDTGAAKIGDVGFSRFMSRTHLTVSGKFGTFDWCAPEVLLGRGATEASDIWSFGVILWELISGMRPRRGQLTPLRAPEQCPAAVAALQRACVAEDPADRPTAAEVLEVLSKLPLSRRASDRAALAAAAAGDGSGGTQTAAAAAGAALPAGLPRQRSQGRPPLPLPPTTPPQLAQQLLPGGAAETGGASPKGSGGGSSLQAEPTAKALRPLAHPAGGGTQPAAALAPAGSLPSPFAAPSQAVLSLSAGAPSWPAAASGSSSGLVSPFAATSPAAAAGSFVAHSPSVPKAPVAPSGGSSSGRLTAAYSGGSGSSRILMSVQLAPLGGAPTLPSPFAAAAWLADASGSPTAPPSGQAAPQSGGSAAPLPGLLAVQPSEVATVHPSGQLPAGPGSPAADPPLGQSSAAD